MSTCTSCVHYKTRYTPKGEVSYTFCAKDVNKVSPTFSCIWHTPKKDSK